MGLRIAVVGTGFGARVQVPGLRAAGCEVVAIVSGSQTNAQRVAQAEGIARWYTDFDRLLADGGLEAVCISGPPDTHHRMTVAAARAGLHVLVEKPAAMSTAEAEEMLSAAQAAGVVHAVDFEFRYEGHRARLKELIEEGALGRVFHARITTRAGFFLPGTGRPWDWLSDASRGGGVLGAIGSHHLDALLWYLGPAREVFARLQTFVPERADPTGALRKVTADDAFTMQLAFTGGAAGLVDVSAVTPGSDGTRLEVIGSLAAATIGADGVLRLARNGAGAPEPVGIPERLRPPRAPGVPPAYSAFNELARRFTAAVRTGQPVSPDLGDGLAVQRVMDAAHRSSLERRVIEL